MMHQNGMMDWVKLKDLKETYPIQVCYSQQASEEDCL